VNKIKSLGAVIRPNVFILPNTDAGDGVGYDDMPCGSGATCGEGLWAFGYWVNGGVWTTTEGRWLLAAARVGDIDPAFQSVRQMRDRFATTWRMDNPLTDFGQTVYQPNEPTNLVVDNFASMGGLLRGLFEYVYTADALTLVPHVPSNMTMYVQRFPVRWGPFRIFLESRGSSAGGITAVSVNGVELPQSAFNRTTLVLAYGDLTASAASLVAMESSVRTAFTRVDLVISFANASVRDLGSSRNAARTSTTVSVPSTLIDCDALYQENIAGLNASKVRSFVVGLNSSSLLTSTLAYSMGRLSLSYLDGFHKRCAAINSGSLPPLTNLPDSTNVSLVQYVNTAKNICEGLTNHIEMSARYSGDSLATKIADFWEGCA